MELAVDMVLQLNLGARMFGNVGACSIGATVGHVYVCGLCGTSGWRRC